MGSDEKLEAERLRQQKVRSAVFNANRARFTTICDLRDEVLRPSLRQGVSFKRKGAFKRTPIRTVKDDKPEAEISRRRKERLAIFDANRANSIAKVPTEAASAVDPDTPAERLFRLEHPDYFQTEPSESREKESDKENVEVYYNPLEELPKSSNKMRRNKKTLSYSELRRNVRERERNEKIQSELAKMQEIARRCQIEDLRHQILEEERVHIRKKLVDLYNERDCRDENTIQHIRKVASSKIAIGRAIRELEDKIAAAEAELSQKRQFEDMVNDQSVHIKCIRYEKLQNGTKMEN
jgi:hypothetical protein